MTAIRKSYLIAVENGFGTGQAKGDKWWPVPQGFYLSYGSSTQTSSLYGTGAKIRQNSIYGLYQGSWSASFVMDFNHLEFLSIIFDQEDNTPASTDTINTEESNKTKANFKVSGDVYEHVFRKVNNRRQVSYVIKERVLNIIAGGEYDEENIIKGVLAKNLQVARSISGSQMAVEMSGVFSDKRTQLFNTMLDSFFVPINDPLTQYSCMYMGDSANLSEDDAVEQLDSHSINIETGVSLVYTTCSPIATDFFEDKTTFSWNATAYMNNPTKKFKLLANSGGTLNPKVGSDHLTPDLRHSDQPMGKNLAPLEYVHFITYDESYRDEYQAEYQGIVDAFNSSAHSVWVQARNSTVKSSTTPKGDGSKLQDSLSSVECDELIIKVRNKKSKIWNDGDKYSNGTTPDTSSIEFSPTVNSSTYTFKIPKEGYAGQFLGSIVIPRSDTAIDGSIPLNGQNGTSDLRGFAILNPELSSSNPSGYALDNLIPKQLTKSGAQPTGSLTVQTSSTVVDEVSTFCPTISGTPSIIRTDDYFIIKKDVVAEGAEQTYTTGYLRVIIR